MADRNRHARRRQRHGHETAEYGGNDRLLFALHELDVWQPQPHLWRSGQDSQDAAGPRLLRSGAIHPRGQSEASAAARTDVERLWRKSTIGGTPSLPMVACT